MTANMNASDSQNIQDNIENSVDGQLAAPVGNIGNGVSQGLQRTLKNEKGIEKIQKLLESSFNELDDIPYFFTSDEIASKIKSNPKSINKILELLKSNGFRASTTIFSPTGFKTDATLGRLIEILR
jgi:tRNA G26 N,N-dimethylase Trm1